MREHLSRHHFGAAVRPIGKAAAVFKFPEQPACHGEIAVAFADDLEILPGKACLCTFPHDNAPCGHNGFMFDNKQGFHGATPGTLIPPSAVTCCVISGK